MPKVNSASRILALLNRTRPFAKEAQAFKAWASLFEVDAKNRNRDYVIVANKLGLMFEELQHIKGQLSKADFDESIYLPTIDKVETAISPQLLHVRWEQVRQHLPEEVFTSLGYCAGILPDEESMITADDFNDLANLIADLKQLLSQSNIPPQLGMVIRHHIELIELAISNYPITGAASLRRAAKQAIGDIVSVGDEMTENKDAPVMQKYQQLWKRVNSIADTTLKAEKLVLLGTRAAKVLENLF